MAVMTQISSAASLSNILNPFLCQIRWSPCGPAQYPVLSGPCHIRCCATWSLSRLLHTTCRGCLCDRLVSSAVGEAFVSSQYLSNTVVHPFLRWPLGEGYLHNVPPTLTARPLKGINIFICILCVPPPTPTPTNQFPKVEVRILSEKAGTEAE